MYGGRGGAKTVSISQALLLIGARQKKKFLCLREFMNSIDDSVHAVLKEEISNAGLSNVFKGLASSIVGTNGSSFKYAQLARNLASIKSKHDFDISWVEEAETVTEESLDVLEPTIRKSGSELWFSFNPESEDSAVYSRYVTPYLDHLNKYGFYEDDNIYVLKIGIEDNPFAPQELIDLSEKMKKENYKKWLHVFGGEPYSDYSESIIQPEWIEAAIDAHKKIKGFEAIGVRSLGFDPADTGVDASAAMARHGSVVFYGKKWENADLPKSIKLVFKKLYDDRIEQMVYDNVGLGVGVKVGLKERIEGKNITVTGFGGGDKVDNPTKIYQLDKSNKNTFKNKRAQYIWLLRDRFEATYNAVERGVFTDPAKLISLSSDIEDLKTLKFEILQVRRKLTDNSIIQIESKKDLKKRGIKSYNMFDSLYMCFANPPPTKIFTPPKFQSEF